MNSRPPKTLDTDYSEAVYGVYGEVAERARTARANGEPPNVDDLIAAHPDLAQAIRDLLPALTVLQQWRVDQHQHDPAHLMEHAREPSKCELGDFRIIRELGHGGMGVVYEAEQISLGRHVALKVLPFAAVLDERQLQRFNNEVLAAGQLDHPHIVNVYGVDCVRGVHYYAMRYVEGQTLADVIRQLQLSDRRGASHGASVDGGPSSVEGGKCAVHTLARQKSEGEVIERGSPRAAEDNGPLPAGLAYLEHRQGPAYFRSVARLAAQIADALDHAHVHGVIHRDVKPSNVIVDMQGKPWLTDFGLAQVESGASLTLSGDIVGTLRYMSPEQARCNARIVDHRCDVYSLGATVYELLALQPALDGTDHKDLIRQLTVETPRRLRDRNRSIPRDLETIVMKAMAHLPEDRYASASDLADDLRRFCDEKPIAARRPSWMDHATKWAVRHRNVVAVGIVLLALTSLVLSWLVTETVKANGKRSGEHLFLKPRVSSHRAVRVSVWRRWRNSNGQPVFALRCPLMKG